MFTRGDLISIHKGTTITSDGVNNGNIEGFHVKRILLFNEEQVYEIVDECEITKWASHLTARHVRTV